MGGIDPSLTNARVGQNEQVDVDLLPGCAAIDSVKPKEEGLDRFVFLATSEVCQ